MGVPPFEKGAPENQMGAPPFGRGVPKNDLGASQNGLGERADGAAGFGAGAEVSPKLMAQLESRGGTQPPFGRGSTRPPVLHGFTFG
jgi:hypothetical protein